MKSLLLFAFALLFCLVGYSQTVYPTHWWAGMKNSKLQLLVHHPNIAASERVSVSVSFPGVKASSVEKLSSPNYLIINLDLAGSVKPGKFPIKVNGSASPIQFTYELKARSKENFKTRIKGVNSKDLVYLIMPDRFSNGDQGNDAFQDYKDKSSNRNDKFARHGGDLKGIENHFDYLSELGVTAIWLTPVIENDMPKMREGAFDMAGYHGYWMTDHYKVDKRFGGNDGYKSFVNNAHKKGLKIVHDAVYNHIGLEHWMHQDLPAKDWINQWPSFTPPNHRVETLFDPYVSTADKNNMLKGWFVQHLPDLNLSNPYVSTYMIQNAIWTVEEFGFDGFRVDTYKYCDENFLNRVNSALLREFPSITTFAEAWANNEQGSAYFAENNLNFHFKHNAPGAIDFPLCVSMHSAMTQPVGWTEGLNRIYMTLAQDRAYKNPLNNCIFLDNHDMNRIFSMVGEDINKFKWGMNWLLTLRGIPQIYYGTEILMKNFKNPTDAEVRLDFPGGWPNDAVNKFTANGRTAQENEAFNHISRLAQFRKSSSALTTGKTMQFIVRDAVYVYFRYDNNQTIMVITNTGNNSFKPDWNLYAERTNGYSQVKNVVTGQSSSMTNFELKPLESGVYELLK